MQKLHNSTTGYCSFKQNQQSGDNAVADTNCVVKAHKK